MRLFCVCDTLHGVQVLNLLEEAKNGRLLHGPSPPAGPMSPLSGASGHPPAFFNPNTVSHDMLHTRACCTRQTANLHGCWLALAFQSQPICALQLAPGVCVRLSANAYSTVSVMQPPLSPSKSRSPKSPASPSKRSASSTLRRQVHKRPCCRSLHSCRR